MDTERLASIARGIGGTRVVSSGNKVTCVCLLARWTHSGGSDSSPSMVMFSDGRHGEPTYTCLGCHRTGTVRGLILDLWTLRRASMMDWVIAVENESTRVDNLESKQAIDSGYVYRSKRALKSFKSVSKGRFKPREPGRPFYDYMAAETELEEIPYEKYEPYAKSVPRYAVEERGLTIETCKAWELGHNKEQRRLMFPMRDKKERLVAISGRLYECQYCGEMPPSTVQVNVCVACGSSIYGPLGSRSCETCFGVEFEKKRNVCSGCHRRSPPKYMHSKGFKSSHILYGENRIKKDRTDGRLYVVEGNVDAPAMWQVGYRPVVAILGSSPSEIQVEKMVRDASRIIVVSDGDKAGKSLAQKIKKMVAGRIDTLVKILPDGEDPSSLMEDLKKFLGEPPVPLDQADSIG